MELAHKIIWSSIDASRLFGLLEMGVFVALLLIGYVYVWRKGALEWD